MMASILIFACHDAFQEIKLKSYKAQFTQTQKAGQTVVTGELFYLYPHYYKVVAHYNNDPKNQILSIKDGNKSINYSNQLNLVMETHIKKAEKEFFKKYGYAPNYISNAPLQYVSDDVVNNEKVKVYEVIVPDVIREKEAQSPKKIMYYISEQDKIPIKIEYYVENDEISEVVETKILERNITLTKKDFVFEVPDGAKVIRQ